MDNNLEFLNTNNESLGFVCKELLTYSEEMKLDDSEKIISCLGLFVSDMINNRSGLAELNFESLTEDNGIPIFGSSKFFIDIDIIGQDGAGKEDYDPEEYLQFYESNNEPVEALSDSDFGIVVKHHAYLFVNKHSSERELIKNIFNKIAYYISKGMIRSKFTMKLPVGDFIINLKFKAQLGKLVFH